MSSWLGSMRIGRKFGTLLGLQISLLLVVAALGWWGVEASHKGIGELGDRVEKSRLISVALNDTNVVRTIHVSMIAAAKDEAYLAKRATRLKEYEDRLVQLWPKVDALRWSEEERPLIQQGSATMRKYGDGFPAVLAKAKAATTAVADTTLMEANVQDQRTGRDNFQKVLQDIQDRSTRLVQAQDASGQQIQLYLIVGTLLTALLGGLFTWQVSRQVQEAAQNIESVMSAVNHGDLSRVPSVENRDEFGHIAGSLRELIESLRRDIRAMAEISERTASGATQLSATAEQLNATTQDLSLSSEKQRSAMDNSSAALEEVAASISEVRKAADEAEKVAEDALLVSAQGRDSAADSSQAMASIEESSSKVARITIVIADIARQTNLLSLNAAIEAAKAGAQGKGFAVVAEEIRKLAERSGSAAKEIASLIQESSERVKNGSNAVGSVDRSLTAIEGGIRESVDRIRAIALAMEEQTKASEDVLHAVSTSAQLTERNASATTELASTIQEIGRTIEELARMANELRGLTSRFRLA